MSRSESAIFTNMCMVESKEGMVLVQQRSDPKWPGIAFPGGHVEKCESFVQSVIREVREETGLTIKNPTLCGIKQFQGTSGERYCVLLFKACEYHGTLQSSDEGEVFWVKKEDLHSLALCRSFMDMLPVFHDDSLSEIYYCQGGHQLY